MFKAEKKITDNISWYISDLGLHFNMFFIYNNMKKICFLLSFPPNCWILNTKKKLPEIYQNRGVIWLLYRYDFVTKPHLSVTIQLRMANLIFHYSQLSPYYSYVFLLTPPLLSTKTWTKNWNLQLKYIANMQTLTMKNTDVSLNLDWTLLMQ